MKELIKNMRRNNISDSYVDTDVLIRLLTGDDPKKQEASAILFEKVEKGTSVLSAPDTAIADAVFVLSSKYYDLSRVKIRDLLVALLRYPNFKVENKQVLIKALDLYALKNIDFGDAMLAVLTLESQNRLIYSYDYDFDKIQGIKRKEP